MTVCYLGKEVSALSLSLLLPQAVLVTYLPFQAAQQWLNRLWSYRPHMASWLSLLCGYLLPFLYNGDNIVLPSVT